MFHRTAVLLSIFLLFAANTASAQDVATLQQEIAKLEQQLESANIDRSALRGRLQNAIAVSKSRQKKLTSTTASSDLLRTRLSRAIAVSKSRQKKLTSATASRDQLSGRLRRAIEVSKSKNSSLSNSTANSDWAARVGTTLSNSISGLEGTEVTTYSNNTVNIRVGNNGLFRVGGILLSDSGTSLLNEIASQLQNQPDANITVIGHTDNVPVGNSSRFRDNIDLSFARATSTLEYFRSVGVPVEQLSAAGYGDAYPTDTNDTDEGRLRNRRVEIVLSPNN